MSYLNTPRHVLDSNSKDLGDDMYWLHK